MKMKYEGRLPQPQSAELYFQIDRVDVVLIDPEVALCYLYGGVVEDLHDDRQRGVQELPGVVTEGFPQGMTADFSLDPDGFHSLRDDPPGLYAGDRLFFLSPVIEDIFSTPVRKEFFQRTQQAFMKRDDLMFPGFSFGQFDVFVELFPIEIIDIFPGEGEQIADAQCGVGAKDDHDVVAQLVLFQVIFRQSLQLSDISYRFCGKHNYPLFHIYTTY